MRVVSEERIVFTPEVMENRTRRLNQTTSPRSPGVHVQAVNKVLGIAAGKLDEDDAFEKFSDTHYPLLPALGVAWEELRASHYSESELVWQPGELERDGIFGTSDGWLLVEEAFWECKLTTKKVQPVTSCWMYLKQGLSYCAMNPDRSSWVPRVRYDICWILGDYARPYQSCATTTLVEFEDREVEAWWKVIVQAAKNVRPE